MELYKLHPQSAVTPTVTVQEALAGIHPPVKVTTPPPFGAVTIPPHVVLALPLMVSPSGNWSVSGAVSASTPALLLLRVRVRVDIPCAVMLEGLNDLPSVGGTSTGGATGVAIKVATAGAVFIPLLV